MAYAGARAVATTVNAIMSFMSMGGSAAGTTETATMLNPDEMDPLLLDEMYMAADDGSLINPGNGQPITREMIDNGEAFYPDYLLEDVVGAHGLSFDEGMGNSERVGGGDGSAGINVGGTRLQAQERERNMSPNKTASSIHKFGFNEWNLTKFKEAFGTELSSSTGRIEFNADPEAFLKKRGYRVQEGILHKTS